jgi:DinB superfamily
MLFHVGIENHNEGTRSIVWALEHPGCWAYGKDADAALAAMPAAIRAYSNWISQHEPAWLRTQNIDINVDDVWNNYFVNDKFERASASENAYAVESWFQYDWKPLSGEEIERALKLLAWSRADLLKTIDGVSDERLDQTYPGEKWTINGILRHIGGAEWWYMERLGRAFPESKLPKPTMERLEKTRKAFLELLPKLEGVKQVVGLEGELWSPRKVLRRTLWHERDHVEHIHKLL